MDLVVSSHWPLKSTRRFQGHPSQRLGRAVALANWPSVKTEGRWFHPSMKRSLPDLDNGCSGITLVTVAGESCAGVDS
jgi:hypothetical protein